MEHKEGQVEHEKLTPPNLLQDFERAVNAIIEVEGAAYTIKEEDKRIISQQMHEALIGLKEYIAEHPETEKAKPDQSPLSSLREFCVGGFEGSGGFNRYGITKQGNIILSGYHCFLDSQTKAKELGFEVREWLI